MLSQRKIVSLIETLTSLIIGLVVALTTQIIVFPWFGIHIEMSSHIGITAIFTVVSVIRGYWVRRLFNYIHVKYPWARI